MNDTRTGYILRNHLRANLQQVLDDASRTVVDTAGENASYELGRALGFTDGLKAALQLLD